MVHIFQSLLSDTCERQVYIPIGEYRKMKVAIKKLPCPPKLELKRKELVELSNMKDLSHDHLVKFYGLCIEQNDCYILTEYCSRGSLQDLLENESLKLENVIIISILQDIIRVGTIASIVYKHFSNFFISTHCTT